MVHINPHGNVFEERTVERDIPVEQFIEALRAAAEGLIEPSVGIDHTGYGDAWGCDYSIIVEGYRPATEEEKRQVEENRIRTEVHRKIMAEAQANAQALIEAEIQTIIRRKAEDGNGPDWKDHQ